ncbi:hypothetical protein FBQ83_10850 [Chloroflexi bacterium CFX5]|nr:hypothetical protein [Anaerolineales bacterium]MDL1919803.1 hypothetical protein [Chloroflexi bacterium CFX5]NUQ60733.1 hypothetical protein [Anaerolineales bacterium]
MTALDYLTFVFGTLKTRTLAPGASAGVNADFFDKTPEKSIFSKFWGEPWSPEVLLRDNAQVELAHSKMPQVIEKIPKKRLESAFSALVGVLILRV